MIIVEAVKKFMLKCSLIATFPLSLYNEISLGNMCSALLEYQRMTDIREKETKTGQRLVKDTF